jgi:sugar diacid utilization regulator
VATLHRVQSELVDRVLDRVDATMDQIVESSVSRFFDQVPAYAASPDPDLRSDVRVHTRAVYEVVLTTLRERRMPRAEDFALTPEQASHRVRQGITLADFLRAFRIGQVTLWEGVVAAAREPETWEVAVEAATYLMNAIEVGSSIAAASYMEAQQLDLAERDQVRRDLVDDLLSGRELHEEARRSLALDYGLDGTTSVLVVVAGPVVPLTDRHQLRSVLSTLRNAVGERGLAIIRHEQIVAILPAAGDAAPVLAGLDRAHRHIGRLGVELAVGASTLHPGLRGVPEAFREANVARESLAGKAGIKALATLSLVDYLVLREDATARRLIAPDLRRFIEEDLRRGGAFVQTLHAYVESNLNAKVAADRLHVHVNTAYYRLDRIAERTGLDLRSFADLEELLVAVRLLTGTTPPVEG